jgi:two-component system, response regulator YesN
MLKVILADDEQIIREGLRDNIDWVKLGMEVAGMAEDGQQALELSRELKPDIIITDIRMPFMSGLEFISVMKKEQPETLIIFISGHDEFEYASKAIKLGAYDYILKPIELDYLTGLLQKAGDKLEESGNRKNRMKDLEEKLSATKPLLLEKLFKDVMFGNSGNLAEQLREIGIDPANHECVAAIINADNFGDIVCDFSGEEIDALDALLQKILDEELRSFPHAMHFSWREKCEKAIFFFGEKGELEPKILQSLKNINHAAESETRLLFNVAAGSVHPSDDIHKSFREACSALNYGLITGNPGFIEYQNIVRKTDLLADLDNLSDSDILAAIEAGDTPRLIHIAGILSQKSMQIGINECRIMQISALRVFFAAMNAISEIGYLADEVLEKPLTVYQNIMACKTVMDVEAVLNTTLVQIVGFLNMKRTGKMEAIVKKARRYIDENFTVSELSLDMVSEKVSTSPCYLSTLFRKETGKTFKDYLTELRIAKAKEYLEKTDMKSYEICYKTGYENPTYFSTLFKKLTGFSPSEYRTHKQTNGGEQP